MKIHIDNRTVLSDTFVEVIIGQAARFVFSSVRPRRQPKDLFVVVKRLNHRSLDANPTGRAWCDENKVVLRIEDFQVHFYPTIFRQSRHPEWPHVEIRTIAEALLIVACHEFAHIALAKEKFSGAPAAYIWYPNFEEWVCENIAVCCLQIFRGAVMSSLKI